MARHKFIGSGCRGKGHCKRNSFLGGQKEKRKKMLRDMAAAVRRRRVRTRPGEREREQVNGRRKRMDKRKRKGATA